MKPFNLEAAKRGDPIVCLNGTPAKFIAHVPEATENQQIVVLINNEIRTNNVTGERNPDVCYATDLFMATKKRTVWVNLYPRGITGVYWCDSEAEADRRNNSDPEDRIGGKAYPVEIEE